MDFESYSRFFGAISSPVRLRILWLLHNQGPLSYTAIMESLGLSASRDAGKFAYHLNLLANAELIDTDDRRRYKLTDYGRSTVEMSRTVEETISRRKGKVMVRTSRMAIEEFDRNKIVNALMKEADIPLDLAEKITDDIEERISNFQVKYLTAPLIREIVNAILIEKGYEQYRHRLTRLGMPVYDVSQNIREAGNSHISADRIPLIAGNVVLEEYSLLNVLPRDVADAHLSGYIHILDAQHLILKPSEFQHDARPLLRNGLPSPDPNLASLPPPKSLHAALSTITSLIRRSSKELSRGCGIDYLNVFLAPFAKSLSKDDIFDAVRQFFLDLNQESPSKDITIGLEADVPKHLIEEGVAGSTGSYSDYCDEAKSLFDVFISASDLDNQGRPLLNPHLVVKVREGNAVDKKFAKALGLSSKFSTVYFMNAMDKTSSRASYLATGTRLSDDWTGNWEVDVLRNGSLGAVILNLPRMTYEAQGDDDKLLSAIEDRSAMAIRALEIKHQRISERMMQRMLPSLSQEVLGDSYFKLASSCHMIGMSGLIEAVTAHLKSKDMSVVLDFAVDLLKHTSSFLSNKTERRATLFQSCDEDVARRFAFLDAEKFGSGKTNPYLRTRTSAYAHARIIPSEDPQDKELMRAEGELQNTLSGGHLMLLPVGDADDITGLFKSIINETKVRFFAFDGNYSYCNSCHKLIGSSKLTCPSCKSSSLVKYKRKSHSIVAFS